MSRVFRLHFQRRAVPQSTSGVSAIAVSPSRSQHRAIQRVGCAIVGVTVFLLFADIPNVALIQIGDAAISAGSGVLVTVGTEDGGVNLPFMLQ